MRILATGLPLIEQPFTVTAVDNNADYLAGWERVDRPGPPPEIDFATEVAIYLGMAGSSSCPTSFAHLVVDADAAHVFGEWEDNGSLNRVCTDDMDGQGVVLAVSRAVLPSGEFILTLRADLICPECPDHPDRMVVRLP